MKRSFFFAIFLVPLVIACTCKPKTISEQVRGAENLIQAEILSSPTCMSNNIDECESGAAQVSFKVKVLRVFKGNHFRPGMETVIHTAGSTAACGLPLQGLKEGSIWVLEPIVSSDVEPTDRETSTEEERTDKDDPTKTREDTKGTEDNEKTSEEKPTREDKQSTEDNQKTSEEKPTRDDKQTTEDNQKTSEEKPTRDDKQTTEDNQKTSEEKPTREDKQTTEDNEKTSEEKPTEEEKQTNEEISTEDNSVDPVAKKRRITFSYSVNICGLNRLWRTLNDWEIYVITSLDVTSEDPCNRLNCDECHYQTVYCATLPCPPVAVCRPRCGAITSEDKCREADKCTPIYGRPCRNTSNIASGEFAGCRDAGLACPEVITCAKHPETGERWTFSDGCVPEGWKFTYGADCCDKVYCVAPDGSRIRPGESYRRDCNECICQGDGSVACTEMACEGTCRDVSSIDFGICRTILGYGVVNGRCQLVSGCPDNVPENVKLWEDLRTCLKECVCIDRTNADYGDCKAILGWSVVDQKCRVVSGCREDARSNIDASNLYSDTFFPNEESCLRSCFGCIDEGELYLPGQTWKKDCNECKCRRDGTIACTDRACDGICRDLSSVDFGLCDAVLGYGVYEGACASISGCSVPEGLTLWSSLEECKRKCRCINREDFDFGNCERLLGYGVIGGECKRISGCHEADEPLFNTLLGCYQECFGRGCLHNGEFYYPGKSFADDCNTCTCQNDGSVACTKIACQGICNDVSGINFGPCTAILGVGVLDGKCEYISGCSVPTGMRLFDDFESCYKQCFCRDRTGETYGNCEREVGWGIIRDTCVQISGCDYKDNLFLESHEDCKKYCFNDEVSPCRDGYTGIRCDKEECTDNEDCGVYGLCVKNTRGNVRPYCTCRPGYRGENCSEAIESPCDCDSTNFTCTNTGRCVCKPGHTGTKCDVVNPDVPCTEVIVISSKDLSVDELKSMVCLVVGCDVAQLEITKETRNSEQFVYLIKFCGDSDFAAADAAVAFSEAVENGEVPELDVEKVNLTEEMAGASLRELAFSVIAAALMSLVA